MLTGLALLESSDQGQFIKSDFAPTGTLLAGVDKDHRME